MSDTSLERSWREQCPSHSVTLRLVATVEVEAGSPDEAASVATSAFTDLKITVPFRGTQLPAHIGFRTPDVIAVAGEGEDPASDD